MILSFLHIVPRLGSCLAGISLTLVLWQFAAAQEPPKNFIVHAAPKPIAAIRFEDEQGRARGIADFQGKVLLLNIWATWCGPCRTEMPSLDRLQAVLAGKDFEIVALSIDRAGIERVRKFYAEIGIRNLAIYSDHSGKAAREVGTMGLPATVLIDREGRELGRLVGPAEWDAPEIVEFLRHVIAQKSSAAEPIGESTKARLQPGPGIAPNGQITRHTANLQISEGETS